MASYDEGGGVGMNMNVVPAGNGGYGGIGGFGDGWWFILVLLCCGNGMWGGMGGGMWPMMMNGLYPWLDNSQNINNGFRDQQLQATVTSIGDRMTSGFGDVQLGIAGLGRQICETGGNITGAVRDAAAQAEISANNRQMANMQQQFAAQTQMAQGFCANREATADLKYTVGTESAANRFASQNNTRDIIENQNRMGQAILDKLCQLELDGVKQNYENRIITLQNALDQERSNNQGLRFAASQTAQNALISQGFASEVDSLYNRLKNCPVGTYSVCNPNIYPGQGCGYNGNGFAA